MKLVNKKGSALLYVVLVLFLLISVVLGLTSVIISNTKNERIIGNSIVAFYAADAGIERMLESATSGNVPNPPEYKNQSLENGSYYTATIFCCSSCGATYSELGCGSYIEVSTDCTEAGIIYCIKSVGYYRGVKRAIEVKI